MMLCVMDVMGPGCGAAWWQMSALAMLEDKLAASRFHPHPPVPLDLCGTAEPIVILECAQARHTMYSVMPKFFCIVSGLYCVLVFFKSPAVTFTFDWKLDVGFFGNALLHLKDSPIVNMSELLVGTRDQVFCRPHEEISLGGQVFQHNVQILGKEESKHTDVQPDCLQK